MPAQAQQKAQGATQSAGGPEASPSTALEPQSRFGNEYLKDRLQQRQSAGKLTWQGALGDTLGTRLYDALSAQLTDDKLLKQAKSAVDSALSALKGQLAGQLDATEEEAAALLFKELDKALQSIARDAVVGSGLSEGIRDTVDAHPYEIALAAAAGAVAYVLSNQDLPLIESKLGLGGGHSLVGGVDPGRTMSLALEQVRVGYRYQGDKVAAHLVGDKFQDGWGAEGAIRYAPSPTTQLALEGKHSDRDGKQSSRLDLSYVDPDVAARAWWEQSKGGDASRQAVGASAATRGGPDELQRHVSGTYRSDGSWEAAAGVGQTEKDRSWSVEAFGGRDAQGREDVGVRALFKLRF